MGSSESEKKKWIIICEIEGTNGRGERRVTLDSLRLTWLLPAMSGCLSCVSKVNMERGNPQKRPMKQQQQQQQQ